VHHRGHCEKVIADARRGQYSPIRVRSALATNPCYPQSPSALRLTHYSLRGTSCYGFISEQLSTRGLFRARNKRIRPPQGYFNWQNHQRFNKGRDLYEGKPQIVLNLGRKRAVDILIPAYDMEAEKTPQLCREDSPQKAKIFPVVLLHSINVVIALTSNFSHFYSFHIVRHRLGHTHALFKSNPDMSSYVSTASPSFLRYTSLFKFAVSISVLNVLLSERLSFLFVDIEDVRYIFS